MDGREGLTQTIRRVGASVRGVANGDTEDVVQEALARAIKSGVSVDAENWLKTVAKRVAIDNHRRRREMPSGAPDELEKWAPVSETNPEDAVIRAERSEAVREAMKALPARYRNALMVYAEEDSPAAVASRLGMSATATWTLLSRARSRLKAQLDQIGFVPAMVMGRPRLRALLATGAAAVAATTTMAILPSTPASPPKAPSVSAPAIESAALTQAPIKFTKPKPSLVAVDTADVTKRVDDAVAQVDNAAAKVEVGTCLPLPHTNDQLGVELTLVGAAEQPNKIARLVEEIPEPLRVIETQLC